MRIATVKADIKNKTKNGEMKIQKNEIK